MLEFIPCFIYNIIKFDIMRQRGNSEMKKVILYNPIAGNGGGEAAARRLEAMYIGHELVFTDITSVSDYAELFASLSPEDEVILCGGDGTLNCFINSINDVEINNNILYYATGSGNDFLNDLGKPQGAEPFRINDYIKNLPYVYVNGMKRRFINGIGYGIDGYCCEVGDKIRNASGKKINYTTIAIKGVLFFFKPRGATVTIDGIAKHYNRVWLAPTMKGRFYGGGMMVAPDRTRRQEDLSVVVAHGCGRLRLLTILPSVFSGTHIKYKNNIEIHHAKEITVEFDNPCSLQIDGETVLDVKSYTAKVAARDAAIVK